jgi:hypothetical protein
MAHPITTDFHWIRRMNQVFTPLRVASAMVEHSAVRPALARQEEMKFQIYPLRMLGV